MNIFEQQAAHEKKKALREQMVINSLDVVIGALNDFVTFCVYWCHFEWEINLISKYFKKLEIDQLMKNKEHMSNYANEMHEQGDDIVTPWCVKKFLDGGYATMANNLYERFKPKNPDMVTNRIKKEREKAVVRLEKDKNKDVMYSIVKKQNFYIQSEHRTMYSELNVIYEIIQDNYTVALKLIKDKKHRTFLKRIVTMMEKFLKVELSEYLIYMSDFYKKDIDVKKPKKIKKKKVKIKKEFFILGEKVNQKKFKKELQFYKDKEEYSITNNEVRAV